ncbi:MAG: tetratricopeptide repeat protein [Saprospiraceae bacterium]|nr:tetratricopeptide repeat protein [Saprospiraceae bacterium]
MKQLIPHFIQEQCQKGKAHGRMQAYTMFVDLSGFTALTETLMAQGTRGAEQLSQALNDIFGPLVRLVYQRGGFIPYFAGDAFMAVFPASGARVTASGFIQTAVMARDLFVNRDFRFGAFPISIKIGLSYGSVEWGIVGQGSRHAYYFRGAPVDHCAESQLAAGRLEIVLDKSLHAALSAYGFSLQESGDGFWRLTDTPVVKTPPGKAVELPPLEVATALRFLPKAVLDFNQTGEFRTVIGVFISFTGVGEHELLDRFATIVLDQAESFSGYFKEIDFGDKGGVMVVFFGAPVSYENNVSRALEFFFALQSETEELRSQTGLQFKAGITIGTAYTGIVGGEERCQYAAVGNRVNLAARLMSYADWGEALTDNEIRKTRQYRFLHKGDIKYKGIKGNVPTFLLLGRNLEQQQSFSGVMVGRTAEMKQLLDFSGPLFDRRSPGLAVIFGEAGSGKSRLCYEMRKVLQKNRLAEWYTCSADQILRKPLNTFLFFLRNYFDQSFENPLQENRRHFETGFEALVDELKQKQPAEHDALLRELLRVRPILAGLLGIHYPGSLWEQLDAKGRYENTTQAVIHLLSVEAALQPFVLEVEDAHWIDEQSAELLHELMRRLYRLPILVLITSRYRDDGKEPDIVPDTLLQALRMPHIVLRLPPLESEAVRSFAEVHLNGKISNGFYEQLLRHTNSNPFYMEQVLEYCVERNSLELENGVWNVKAENIDLSGSIQSILTARIDRLSNLARETVKAAAVIGREFELPVLNAVMNHQIEFAQADGNPRALLNEQIKTGERGQIWHALTELRYIFRHSLLREAAYNMQMRSRLSYLHSLIGQAIEQLHADDLQERYADLAFHFEQAGIVEKTCEYLLKAADHARRNFQNQQALHYYDKLIEMLPRKADAAQVVKAHLRRGKILEATGRWDECREGYARALRSAQRGKDQSLLGQAANHLGQVLLLQGDYAGAQKYFDKALSIFEEINDQIGIARANGNLGNLYFRQGRYPIAKDCYTRSTALAREVDPASISAQTVANLALAYMNQGDYENAVRTIEEQIPLSQNLGDKPGIASLYTNLGIVFFEKGDYDAALASYRQGLALSEELGNKMLTAINIGCIGSVYERQGDYSKAMQHFTRDLELVEEMGDKQGQAIALGLIGELLSFMGEFGQAVDYLQKGLMLCEELGYRKGLAKAVNTLGDVFFFTGQYDRAIQYYDRAIEVTRSIDAKMVLGMSLVEKGIVLARLKDVAALELILKDALGLVAQLGNAELEFETHILAVKVLFLKGNTEAAGTAFSALERMALKPVQQAALAYERALLFPQEESLRLQALEGYRRLYAATPKYLFKMRIAELEQEPTSDH